MLSSTTFLRLLCTSAFLLPKVLALTCSGARNLALCAEFITPFSTNNFTWRNDCGLDQPATDILMAQSIQFNSGNCPQGTTATCCTSCLACGNVGVDCSGPATNLPPLGSEQLPLNWTVAVPCAIDNANRVIENTVVTYLPTTTPSSCVAQCAAQGFTFAGVEFSDECYCGTGYTDGMLPPEADVSECNMPCAGDVDATCGGSWRMQVYRLSR
ncbi:hypothetical protein BDY19DRAFT_19154 [Irpex rosettiformis]|uniref:Uncharacterized protein n=1 Tax=Irpex rosettiformis TaxID=378272 RepID=A0ACB8UJ89_9APHY|nr:hypothetical protein BDY19DRAFT_19154 [Irpex rosettiformis]